ncbi:hypothetical protein KIH74_22270 [Kineosporia sp. J2-2]|uniref:Alpha-tubulin suppressor n=1 Tax=Kineosporia corallincola TaxID=2835133 RepID=A0ABS5TKR1_9ACTN|nr:hypothetical protein [Kineosporia corallincola]MBT0771682.1 hypothetical protein [Kineosporia corallincola]
MPGSAAAARRWATVWVLCLLLLAAVATVRPAGAAFTATTGTGSGFSASTWSTGPALYWSGDNTSGSAGESGTGDTVAVRGITAVAGGQTFSALGTGLYHSCGIATDGTLWCWGRNGGGQLGRGALSTLEATPQPVDAAGTTWRSVTGGEEVTCALQSSPTDGSVWCWGYGGMGQLAAGTTLQKTRPNRITHGGTVPETWRSLSGDGNRFCALDPAGGLWCWGRAADGETGDGTTTNRTVPVPVESGATWSSVAAGPTHTCAVAAGGSVQGVAVTPGQAFCWGANGYGQTGTGTTSTRLTVPTAVGAAGSTGVRVWASLASGSRSTCGITADAGDPSRPAGQLWCWGQLGDGGTATTGPAQDGTSTGWTSIDAGGDGVTTFCGVDGGALSCRGGSPQFQAGDGTTSYRTAWGPVLRGTGTGWDTVSVARAHGCALTSAGQAFCWGSAEYGQPGNGAVWYRNTLRDINSAQTAGWSAPDGETDHTCALQGSALFCWGRNTSGQLGTGDTVSHGTPQPVAGAWAQVTVGSDHTCALDTDGVAWCWGRNLAGSVLGTGSNSSVSVPTRVVVTGVSGDRWLSLDAGLNATCGIRSDGTLWCWGAQSQGVLGNGTAGTYLNRPTQVSGGGTDWDDVQVGSNEHACGMRVSHALYCWGNNSAGQIGTGTSGGTRPSPTLVTGSWAGRTTGTATGLAAGYAVGHTHTCALDTGGVLWCWGSGGDRQFGLPSSSADSPAPVTAAAAGTGRTWTSVLAGGNSTCATRSDGGLWCWGHNYHGKLGQGSDSTTVSSPALSSATTPVAARLSRVSLFVVR